MKFKDYQLDALYLSDVDAYNNYLLGFLKSAIAKFYDCEQDLTDRNDSTLLFNVTLTELEEEVLANLIILEWTGKELRSAEDLRRTLGDGDFKLYSGANSLKEKRNLNNDTREEVDKLITEYSWSNANLDEDFI